MSSYSSSSSTVTVDDDISAVPQDVIQTHILTRLDGPALAATSCASSQLHALSTQDDLWRQICTATWPSITDENISRVVSTFPAGHRSFFSDAFPALDHLRQPSERNPDRHLPNELVSCVDIHYKNALIVSKTHVIETATAWFYAAPLRVDLFDSKDSVLAPTLHGGEGDTWLKDLEENLTLSWILIDPVKKRAVNISSGRAVAVERQWSAGDVLRARFATIMAGDYNSSGRSGSSEMEYVKCEVAVTCVRSKEKGGEVHVREVSMQVEDMEGRSLSGRDSLVILQEAMENGKRRKRGEGGQNGKVRYEEFTERKRVRKEKKDKRERVLDMACICVGFLRFKYVAASEAAKEAVWLRKFLQDLEVVPAVTAPLKLFCDNSGAVAQSKEPRNHKKQKHIERKYHLIRDIVQRGDVEVTQIASQQNLADPFTKAIPGKSFNLHFESMGMREMPNML